MRRAGALVHAAERSTPRRARRRVSRRRRSARRSPRTAPAAEPGAGACRSAAGPPGPPSPRARRAAAVAAARVVVAGSVGRGRVGRRRPPRWSPVVGRRRRVVAGAPLSAPLPSSLSLVTVSAGGGPGTSSAAISPPPQPAAASARTRARRRAGAVRGEGAWRGQDQRGSAAMRRPQCGQSLRSFCASWSHQLQKRRFSTDHGSDDVDGGERAGPGRRSPSARRCPGRGRSAPPRRRAGPRGRSTACAGGTAGPSSSAREPSNGAGGRSSPAASEVARRSLAGEAFSLRCARRVRVLIFHGYLLRGTGSNVYNAALGEAFVRAGHEVHLLCQDRDAARAAVGRRGRGLGLRGRSRLDVRRDPPRATVYRPDLGGLLPGLRRRPLRGRRGAAVPGPDRRRGRAPTSSATSPRSREVVARARPDVALANHLVMGPLILARALAGTGVPYAVKVHGSALEYTVKPHPALPARGARGRWPAPAACSSARGTPARACGRRSDEPGLEAKTRLGPPGVDVEPLRAARARRRRRRRGSRRSRERLAGRARRPPRRGVARRSPARPPRRRPRWARSTPSATGSSCSSAS